jgi:hypothetical protein
MSDRGFIGWRPQRRTRNQIDTILNVLVRYEDVLPLTLRQLFYILVAAEVVAKTDALYRAIGYTVRKARRARLIDFDATADDGSMLPRGLIFDSAADLGWPVVQTVNWSRHGVYCSGARPLGWCASCAGSPTRPTSRRSPAGASLP